MIDPGRVREVLERAPPTVDRVALSGDTVSSPDEENLLGSMEAVLRHGGEAVVSVRAVSEAVKVVEGGWVVGSLDRSSLVSAVPPVLFDREALAGLSGASAREWVDPVQVLLEAGGRVRTVSFPDPGTPREGQRQSSG